jgi:hypothetical protein
MRLIDSLERRYQRFAVPGLLRILAVLQAVVYIMLLFRPVLFEYLTFDTERFLGGELWRIFTFIWLPTSQSIIWAIFSIYMLVWIGDGLEQAWGAFRLTLYVGSTWLMLVLAGWLDSPSIYLQGMVMENGRLIIRMVPAAFLFLSIFLAFCTLFPNFTLNLYGILPVKAKWLGWLDAAVYAYMFYKNPDFRIAIGLSLVPYAMLALPMAISNWKQQNRVQARRAKFAENSLPADEALYRCHVCGKTDQTNPELEFRVGPDEVEYCMEHLPK